MPLLILFARDISQEVMAVASDDLHLQSRSRNQILDGEEIFVLYSHDDPFPKHAPCMWVADPRLRNLVEITCGIDLK